MYLLNIDIIEYRYYFLDVDIIIFNKIYNFLEMVNFF